MFQPETPSFSHLSRWQTLRGRGAASDKCSPGFLENMDLYLWSYTYTFAWNFKYFTKRYCRHHDMDTIQKPMPCKCNQCEIESLQCCPACCWHGYTMIRARALTCMLSIWSTQRRAIEYEGKNLKYVGEKKFQKRRKPKKKIPAFNCKVSWFHTE